MLLSFLSTRSEHFFFIQWAVKESTAIIYLLMLGKGKKIDTLVSFLADRYQRHSTTYGGGA